MLSRKRRSVIFTRYNTLKPTTNRPRLNRALGIAQSNNKRPYRVTAVSCTCYDHNYRGRKSGEPCKHQLALQLTAPTSQSDQAEAPATPRRSLAQINEELFG